MEEKRRKCSVAINNGNGHAATVTSTADDDDEIKRYSVNDKRNLKK